MTKIIIGSYTLCLMLTLGLIAVTPLMASEVTGTLSSDATNTTPAGGTVTGTVTNQAGNTGNLEGTVLSASDGNGGGGSSSGNRNRNGDSANNTPTSAVLGATDTPSTVVPGFPNAGVAPSSNTIDPSLWSMVFNFFKGMLTF